MYPAVTASGAGVAGLAYTGVNVGWQIVAGVTLLAVGFAVSRLVPKARRIPAAE